MQNKIKNGSYVNVKSKKGKTFTVLSLIYENRIATHAVISCVTYPMADLSWTAKVPKTKREKRNSQKPKKS